MGQDPKDGAKSGNTPAAVFARKSLPDTSSLRTAAKLTAVVTATKSRPTAAAAVDSCAVSPRKTEVWTTNKKAVVGKKVPPPTTETFAQASGMIHLNLL